MKSPSATETESRIVEAWRTRSVATPLVDSAGRSLSVIYPGRRNGAAGPDFRDAILADADGTLLRGHVEIHRRAADWLAHGHQIDPAYENVVLHIIGSGPVVPVPTNGGLFIPTVRIEPAAAPSLPAISCPPAELEAAVDAVREAGDRWFDDRAARLAGSIDSIGADETAWRGVLDVLGYGGNRSGFAAIADALPWPYLCDMIGVKRERAAALLLGAAGLASGQQVEEWRQLGAPRPATPIVWKRAGLRPANRPERRLHAAVLFAQSAVLPGPAVLIASAVSSKPADMLRTIVARFEGSIGTATATILAVNLAFPFAHVLGDIAAAGVYQRFPRLPENADTRDMADLLFAPNGRALMRGARDQQGLLYLYRRWCRDKDCSACPVGQTTLRNVPDSIMRSRAAP